MKNLFPNGANIFTDYLQGPCFPWLLGTNYKVPYTGHVMFKRSEAEKHYKTLASADPGWENEITAYGINAVAMPTNHIMYGNTTPLLTKLAYNPDWILAAVDPEGLTYLKRQEGTQLAPLARLAAMKIYWLRVIDGVKMSDRLDQTLAETTIAKAQTVLQKLATISRLTEPDLSRELAQFEKNITLPTSKEGSIEANQPH